MENLEKLACHLIDEADRMAMAILHEPSMRLKELDMIVKLCESHTCICEAVEIKQKYGGDHDHDDDKKDSLFEGM